MQILKEKLEKIKILKNTIDTYEQELDNLERAAVDDQSGRYYGKYNSDRISVPKVIQKTFHTLLQAHYEEQKEIAIKELTQLIK